MGEEINKKSLNECDPVEFKNAVQKETKILTDWVKQKRFLDEDDHFGFELEGCLIDQECSPMMKNLEFLEAVGDPAVVPELAKFNFEVNSRVYLRNPKLFREMLEDLNESTKNLSKTATEMNLLPIWIGILPTVRDSMLDINSMTDRNRYFALAEKILELRKGKPIELNIDRFDSVSILRDDIMTEGVATSLQIHTQTRVEDAVRAYNASLLLSGPCTAITANSPFLYGKKLWDETRIPVFEQSLAIPMERESQLGTVTLGDRYVKDSIAELFEENLNRHKALLPVQFKAHPEKLRHLKFLNGQIWRWVRPIIGVDYGKEPHLRIEQRCFPAGPSNVDTIANIAFYVGLLHYYTHISEPLEKKIRFHKCRDNFYQCAKLGMKAEVTWEDGTIGVQNLLHDVFIDRAKEGLEAIGVDSESIEYFIGDVIKNRVRTGWTGAAWQKSFIDTHGFDFKAMTSAYVENQKSGAPVYQWKV